MTNRTQRKRVAKVYCSLSCIYKYSTVCCPTVDLKWLYCRMLLPGDQKCISYTTEGCEHWETALPLLLSRSNILKWMKSTFNKPNVPFLCMLLRGNVALRLWLALQARKGKERWTIRSGVSFTVQSFNKQSRGLLLKACKLSSFQWSLSCVSSLFWCKLPPAISLSFFFIRIK